MKLHQAFLFTVLVALAGCGKETENQSTTEEVAPDTAREIRNGDEKVPSQYDSVGKLSAIIESEEYYCTGTLITPQIVLTAAHCAVRSSYFPYEVFPLPPTSLKFNVMGADREVESVRIHPAYFSGYSAGGDLAMLRLKAPVTGIHYSPLWRGEFSLVENAELAIVGVGRDENDFADPSKLGIKRIGIALLSDFLPSLLDYLSTPEAPAHAELINDAAFSVRRGPKGQIACNGDSGSGAFSQGFQVGVLSTGWSLDEGGAMACKFEQVSFYESTKAYSGWMLSTLESLAIPPGSCRKANDALYATEQGGCRYLAKNLVFSAEMSKPKPHAGAIKHCKDLSEFTFGDWRLPTKAELNLAMTNEGLSHLRVTGNAGYWTSTPSGAANAFVVKADRNSTNLAVPKAQSLRAICVRTIK